MTQESTQWQPLLITIGYFDQFYVHTPIYMSCSYAFALAI